MVHLVDAAATATAVRNPRELKVIALGTVFGGEVVDRVQMLAGLEVLLPEKLRRTIFVGGVGHGVSHERHQLNEDVGHFSKFPREAIVDCVEGKDVQQRASDDEHVHEEDYAVVALRTRTVVLATVLMTCMSAAMMMVVLMSSSSVVLAVLVVFFIVVLAVRKHVDCAGMCLVKAREIPHVGSKRLVEKARVRCRGHINLHG